MSRQEDIVAEVRKLLQQWDDGLLVAGEFECLISGLDEFFEVVEKGETYMRFGSCCCSAHSPNRTFKIEVTIKPHGFIAKRVGEVVESGPETV